MGQGQQEEIQTTAATHTSTVFWIHPSGGRFPTKHVSFRATSASPTSAMPTFDAEAFAFLSSIKEPVLKDGATRTRLLDMMNSLTAPHPAEIMQWLQMAEFRAFAFDNLLVDCVETWAGYRTQVHPLWIFLLLGKFIAAMLGQDKFECTIGGTLYQCPWPEEEVKMELEYTYDRWAYETEDSSIDMPYEGDLLL